MNEQQPNKLHPVHQVPLVKQKRKDTPEDLAKLKELFKEMSKQYPLNFWFPYEQQEEFIRAKNKMRLFIGGNRIGKTESGIIEDVSWCLGERRYLQPHDPDFKTPIPPPVHGLITTESLGSEGTAKKVIEAKLKRFVPAADLKSTKKNQQGVTVHWEFKNGSSLSVMSYEQEVEKFEGFSIHFWHGDEPPKEKIYGAIQRGLVDFEGWSWITMTPVASEAFTIKLFEDPNNYRMGPLAMKHNIRHVRRWYQSQVKVGGLSEEAIRRFEESLHAAGLDPAEISARISGEFKYLKGKILPFNSQEHVVERFKILPSEGTMYVAIDPHDNKPWAISFLIAHSNGNFYTVDELWIKSDLTGIINAIQDKLSQYKMQPKVWLIDPQAIVEESDMESLLHKLVKGSRNMTYPLKLQKAARGEAPKRQGIQLWRAEMDSDEDKGVYSSHFIFKDCMHTIRQINGWVYDDLGKAIKKEDDFPENHYRIFNINPRYVQNDKKKKTHKTIKGIGS
jgi:hypothetical protein